MQYFMLINLSCLLIFTLSRCTDALWYKRVTRHSFPSYKSDDLHEHCECGKKNISPSWPRIIGGQEVSENEFPWMAGIISVNQSRLICGASIINDRYVITAAHCVPYGFNKDDLKVSVGAHSSCKWDTKSTIFSVESIIPHPRYERNTNFADIMLVKLIMKITFNNIVRPICLPKLGFDAVSTFAGQFASVLGWGLSENNSMVYPNCGLRIVDLMLFKQSECPTNVSTLICAGHKQLPRGTCAGDSGGPLQILDKNQKHVLIGITSNGVSCANIYYPDFYTDVTRMISWIIQVTKHDSNFTTLHLAPQYQMRYYIFRTSLTALLFVNCSIRILTVNIRDTISAQCGVAGGGISNRIVGGQISIPHIFPWAVAIFNKGNLHCGGTLINNQYVLTAGHCVKWTNHNDLTLGLGMHDIEDPNEGYIIDLDKVILHEDFESDRIHDTNDIALIRLRHPIRITDHVTPVCLPHKGTEYAGRIVKVIGWGRVLNDGAASQYLRQASLKVMSYRDCKNTTFGNHITESMLCAYAENKDACQGDSGGPLLYERSDGKNEIAGVVSWGIGCANPGMPGVYVKNTDYLNWIKYHSKDGIYCVDS
ncbi:transmembrane protease serine 9-like [Pseudomyrmex gracilis]|uniref:transmembrane protease serine 9-like n=1 Tax=Pseudomyrmex gracilis TaxID=219809 RepID=UPI000995A57F|nr:transmembrane protease serine 9-like [Pseudomyrmex gracilis]